MESLEELSRIKRPRLSIGNSQSLIACITRLENLKYDSIKINTVFNGEFVTGEKRANKSIVTRNYELYCYV
ncbi:hypothetical protein ALC56_03800 [Trachymyrmex septentrionalis]|uniref:Uncharacterized protein n=1 Tax=Trachymyrmex septentrionalis TaxID=34720 RepID=A0A151JZD3_9HYME|nr:hypothetical protein ALC56_03800 [Trachymyrmex septentrionalis]